MKLISTIVLAKWFSFGTACAGILYTNLFSFSGTNGTAPEGSLLQTADGYFYGSTDSGGTNGGYGTVFQMSPDGSVAALISFSGTNGPCLGSDPSQLIKANDGNLYGTTFEGGTNGGTNGLGTVFRMTTNGAFTTLFSFTGTNGPYLGANPGPLIGGIDGNLYGTTHVGGNTNPITTFGFGYGYGDGTVFKIDTNGNLTTLLLFTSTNGLYPGRKPLGSLFQDSGGFLYGTTEAGGTNGDNGTVFKITTNGNLVWSFSFASTNGADPQAGLVPATDGDLYGVTSDFSSTPNGSPVGSTIFRITTNGIWSNVAFLTSPTIPNPVASLLQGPDGNLYGTFLQGPARSGSVFRATTNGSVSLLYTFSGGTNDGGFPFGGLILALDNDFYGLVSNGGGHTNGAVYRLSVPFAPVLQTPVIISTDGPLALAWSAVAGQSYQLQSSTNLSATNWQNLGLILLATNGVLSTTNALGDPQRFYRVAVQP